MTIEPLRWLPEMTAARESLVLQHCAISRRARALIEHNDNIEANAGDATAIKYEIVRAFRALAAIDQLLNTNQGGRNEVE